MSRCQAHTLSKGVHSVNCQEAAAHFISTHTFNENTRARPSPLQARRIENFLWPLKHEAVSGVAEERVEGNSTQLSPPPLIHRGENLPKLDPHGDTLSSRWSSSGRAVRRRMAMMTSPQAATPVSRGTEDLRCLTQEWGGNQGGPHASVVPHCAAPERRAGFCDSQSSGSARACWASGGLGSDCCVDQ